MPKRKSRGGAPHGCYWRGATLWGRVFVRGQEFRRSLDTDDAPTAKKRRADLKARLLAVKHGDARLTFAEVIDAWKPWIAHQVGGNTVKRYACSLVQLAPFVAGKYLDEINGTLTSEIIRARRASGATDATIKRDLVALSSVMNFAVDEGWQEANLILPRLKRIKERRDPIMLPRPQDVDKAIARCPGLFGTMVAAARATGCRQEELANARHAHLDRKAGRLTVVGKRNKLRVIDLTPMGGTDIFNKIPKASPAHRYSGTIRASATQTSQAASLPSPTPSQSATRILCVSASTTFATCMPLNGCGQDARSTPYSNVSDTTRSRQRRSISGT
jgi:integrase/recombinase XerD